MATARQAPTAEVVKAGRPVPRRAMKARRIQLGKTPEDMAEEVCCSPQAWKAWEARTRNPRPHQRPKIAKALEVSPEQCDFYLDGEQITAPNGHQVPRRLKIHASLEQGASHIWAWHSFTVHALLQTEAYATAVERADAVPKSEEGVVHRVALRMARQGVLRREPGNECPYGPLDLSVILDESVLSRTTGGREVMADQLTHLVAMAGLPNVHLRILPRDAGQHSAAFGVFTMIDTQGVGEPHVVCVEDRTGIRYLEEPSAIDDHEKVFDRLWRYALSPEESLDLIRACLERQRYQS